MWGGRWSRGARVRQGRKEVCTRQAGESRETANQSQTRESPYVFDPVHELKVKNPRTWAVGGRVVVP